MVARSFPCDPLRLKSFLDDELPEREQIELNDHLETCADCQRGLERLAAGTGFWGDLRQLTPRLGARLRPRTSTPETADHGTPGRSESVWDRDHSLEFLASSDDPGSLGRLGLYDVTELLGRGGFGVVLKAFDPTLGRAVAIKVLAPQLATSAAARSRFAREARPPLPSCTIMSSRSTRWIPGRAYLTWSCRLSPVNRFRNGWSAMARWT